MNFKNYSLFVRYSRTNSIFYSLFARNENPRKMQSPSRYPCAMQIAWAVDCPPSSVVVCAASSFWHGPIFQSSEHTCVILSFRDEAIHLSSRNSVEPKKHQAIHNAMSRMINGGTLQSNIHIDSDLKNTLHNWWMIYHLSTAADAAAELIFKL